MSSDREVRTGARHDPAGRIGIVISMFPELHETFILRELVALERRGVDFEIFSLQFPRDPITLEEARRLSDERTRYSGLLTPRTLLALSRALLRHPKRLATAVRDVVVQGRDRPGELLKNLAILPVTLWFGEQGRARGVTHWHGHWANIPTTACFYLARVHAMPWSAAIHGEDIFSPNRFLAYKLDEARFCVVCSGFFCRHLKEEIGLADPDRVHLNYHGLDPRVLEHAERRKPLSPTRAVEATADTSSKAGDRVDDMAIGHAVDKAYDDATGNAPGDTTDQPSADTARKARPKRLVSIGRLVPTKGHDTLIRAFALLQALDQPLDVEPALTIIGSGPEESRLKRLASELGIAAQIAFVGALAFEDVLTTLDDADLFVLAPRLIPGQPPDGIPNVIAEAMALGIPVVSTRVSAIPELVDEGESGWLVAVDDVDALAAAMHHVLTDSTEARARAASARGKVNDLFDQDRNIEALIDLFRRSGALGAGNRPWT